MRDTLWFLFFASWPVVSGGLLILFARYYPAGGKGAAVGGKPLTDQAAANDGQRLQAWLRLGVGNALVFLLLASLVFLGGEIYYRYIYDSTDSFNYTLVSQRWQERYYHKNAQTVRDNVNYQLQIPPGKRRVTFIGDSFTAGHGVKDVEDRFANRIRRAHPQWDVQVMAGLGADTRESGDVVRQLVEQRCALDLVVLVYCLNDISDIVPETKEMVGQIYADSKRLNWLARNSYFANLLHYRLKARRNPTIMNFYSYLAKAYRGPLWEKQADRLTAVREQVEANGGRLLVVTFPFLHAPLNDTYEFRFAHERLAEFWEQSGVPHLDLVKVYKPWPPRKLVVNRMDAHPNEFAHTLAAKAIEKFIQENMGNEKEKAE